METMNLNKKIFIIARISIRELLAQKVVYVLGGICAVFFFLVSFLGYFDAAEQIKILHDMGITFLSFFAFCLILFGVPSVIHCGEEKEKDVIFITKPLRREEYLWGKIFGVIVAMTLCLSIVALVLLSIIFIRTNHFDVGYFTLLYLVYLKYITFISIIVLLCMSCDLLMVYFLGIVVFIVSNGITYFETVAQQTAHKYSIILIGILKTILPRYDYFNVIEAVTLNKVIPIIYVTKVTFYTLLYSGIVFLLAQLIYKRKEF
ncbi:hypothetical protein ACFL3D_04560 [Candidatus Omnitrophota bacterium]